MNAKELLPVTVAGPFDAKAMTSTNIPRLSAMDSRRLIANFMGVLTKSSILRANARSERALENWPAHSPSRNPMLRWSG